jgi:hypothetical protein
MKGTSGPIPLVADELVIQLRRVGIALHLPADAI